MSRPIRREIDRYDQLLASSEKVAIGNPHPNIDRAVAEADFIQLACGCFLFAEAQSRQ
jgi:hypothetical protein